MNREAILAALLTLLSSAGTTTIVADIEGDSPILGNVSSTAGLLPGLPLFGPGLPPFAQIDTIDSDTQITMKANASASAAGASIKTGFQTINRELMLVEKVQALPALFLRKADEHDPPRGSGMPNRTTLDVEAWIYASAGDSAIIDHSRAFNPLLDALDDALRAPPVINRQTLGGMVHHCWKEGDTVVYSARLKGPAIVVVPISILVPI